MSTNGDVDFNGDSYFFACGPSRVVADIAGDDRVGLAFSAEPGLLAGGGLLVAVERGRS